MTDTQTPAVTYRIDEANQQVQIHYRGWSSWTTVGFRTFEEVDAEYVWRWHVRVIYPESRFFEHNEASRAACYIARDELIERGLIEDRQPDPLPF